MASSEPFMGSIDYTAFPFAIKNWAMAQGQLMPISQNQALFSLLGTYYGGNGITTYALPNLSGQVPVGQGQGPGLSPRAIGEEYGQEQVTLTAANMPQHEHPVQLGGTGSADNTSGPAVQGTTAGTGGRAAVSGIAGGNQPFPVSPPSLVLAAQIALYGIYPSRW